MTRSGDTAPDFTVPLVSDGDFETFTLSENLHDAPLVLAFFPAAFSSVCTDEMCTFRDRLAEFEDVDATVYGVSTDLPWALSEFRDRHDLSFGLLSDADGTIVDAYDVRTDFESMALSGIAQRAVFVVDSDGDVTYAWVADDPGTEPDYDDVALAADEARP